MKNSLKVFLIFLVLYCVILIPNVLYYLSDPSSQIPSDEVLHRFGWFSPVVTIVHLAAMTIAAWHMGYRNTFDISNPQYLQIYGLEDYVECTRGWIDFCFPTYHAVFVYLTIDLVIIGMLCLLAHIIFKNVRKIASKRMMK